jgi:hypothetical protein
MLSVEDVHEIDSRSPSVFAFIDLRSLFLSILLMAVFSWLSLEVGSCGKEAKNEDNKAGWLSSIYGHNVEVA